MSEAARDRDEILEELRAIRRLMEQLAGDRASPRKPAKRRPPRAKVEPTADDHAHVARLLRRKGVSTR